MNILLDSGTTKTDCFFSDEEKKPLKLIVLPKHIAIIPDGNRRWARDHLFSIKQGHVAGIEAFIRTVKATKELGIETLTMFGFSTENWQRGKTEVAALMYIFEHYGSRYIDEILSEGIVFRCIGDIEKLPTSLQQLLRKAENASKDNKSLQLVVALNYGGKNELVRAIQNILRDTLAKKIDPDQLSESLIESYLDTQNLPDPDLIIRTSGEQRLSNFLLWQSSYSELYIEPNPWPEFTPKNLLEAVIAYGQRMRRKGGN